MSDKPKRRTARPMPVFTSVEIVHQNHTVRFAADEVTGAYIEVSLLDDGSGIEVRSHPDGLMVVPHVANLISIKPRP